MPAANEGGGEARSGRREIVLFLHALRLAMKAQRVRSRALDEVAAEMASAGHLPCGVAVGEAVRAAGRACTRVRRWGRGLDSCLTRSLVAGTLLADRPEVFVHVGFRPTVAGTVAEGHAWVSVGGEVVGVTTPPDHAGPFVESLQLPMHRGGDGGKPWRA